jgi:hypothetical protein
MEQSSFSWVRKSGIDFALSPVRAEGRACAHALGSCFIGKTKGRYLMRRMGGIVLTVTGFLACHLIITLPLLISLLAGTAVGSFLSCNTGLVTTFAGIYYVVVLALGAWFLFGLKRGNYEKDAACPTCRPVSSDMHMQERSTMPEDQPATRR